MKHLPIILLRYLIATLGLALVAVGVALSLKSNLGTAPISCPPAVLNLRFSGISVGTFTWMMHLVLILFQLVLLRSKFRLVYLMQIPAAFVFGYLCDAAIWACAALPAGSYGWQLLWSLAAVVVTAIGLRIEVLANAWMIAGDKATQVLAEVSGAAFSNVKVCFDVFFVLVASAFALIVFGHFFGDGSHNVIREGTLILALFTGLCMKLTDPLVCAAWHKCFPRGMC